LGGNHPATRLVVHSNGHAQARAIANALSSVVQ